MSLTIKCKLCPKEFGHKPLNVPPVPEPVPTNVYALIGELTRHMEKKHPDEHTSIKSAMSDFYGLSLLTMFEHEDPTLIARLEQTRNLLLNALGVKNAENENSKTETTKVHA